MPIGQAHTTWFPELKLLLKDKWKINLTIPEQLKLLADLIIKKTLKIKNVKLKTILKNRSFISLRKISVKWRNIKVFQGFVIVL